MGFFISPIEALPEICVTDLVSAEQWGKMLFKISKLKFNSTLHMSEVLTWASMLLPWQVATTLLQ